MIVLVACDRSDGERVALRALHATPVRIEVPNARNLQFFTLWVALGAGLFQAEGLEPQVLVDPSPRSAGSLLLRGDADVAVLQPPMFLGMMAEEKPILPVRQPARERADQSRRAQGCRRGEAASPERPVARTPGGDPRACVSASQASRRRGCGALFASAGIDAARDVELVIVRGPDQVQALADHRVDALFSHTPYLETALVKHGAVLLVETSSGEVPALADGQIHALATTPALAKEKGDLILAVTRAIHRAQRLIHSDLKATVDALIASGAAGAERALTEAIAAVYGPAVPQTPAVSVVRHRTRGDAVSGPSPRARFLARSSVRLRRAAVRGTGNYGRGASTVKPARSKTARACGPRRYVRNCAASGLASGVKAAG